MRAYLARRLALVPLTLLAVTFGVFMLASLAPGDPATVYLEQRLGHEPTAAQIAQQRARWGLNDPLPARYATWVADAATGDLGTSFFTGEPVASEILHRLPFTVELALPAAALALLGGIVLGSLSALKPGSLLDQVGRLLALGGASVPSFWAGLLLIQLLAVDLHLLPAEGDIGPLSWALPVLTLSLGPGAVISRLIRASLLEVLEEDYVRTARAKGLGMVGVLARHGLKNALPVVITAAGGLLGGFLTGVVVIEKVFAWPGLGSLTVDAIFNRDYPLIQGVFLFAGLVVVAVNLAVDLSYPIIDPRVMLGAKRGGR